MHICQLLALIVIVWCLFNHGRLEEYRRRRQARARREAARYPLWQRRLVQGVVLIIIAHVFYIAYQNCHRDDFDCRYRFPFMIIALFDG